MEFIRKLFGLGPKVNMQDVVNKGAIILDVRTKAEFQRGHVKGSVNIPLDQLSNNISKLDHRKTIVTCCASGMRSASAKGILRAKGFETVHNGGSWQNVNRYKNK
ncbi:MAG: rhodanese-like domain-containing protein [Candidatus Competibacteraceae bacterium]|nr:rhodanese-like domain-containing protein [Candidatus Competibacteraceae bacterium]